MNHSINLILDFCINGFWYFQFIHLVRGNVKFAGQMYLRIHEFRLAPGETQPPCRLNKQEGMSTVGVDDVEREPNVSGSESFSVVRKCKVQIRFDAVMDELLAKEVLAHNPFEADFGAVGPTWERVADALRVGVDGRRCRERVELLVKSRKRRVNELERASGIEETVSDLDAMIDEIITIQESSNVMMTEKKRVLSQADRSNAEGDTDLVWPNGVVEVAEQ
ncbi:hypothetical protein P43SY_002554 [Pythium insidiosum]|uniref:Uncharacterized protein n=1 Tax=Pythium insidiosum TaxID=114742 RepID=A0AAD5LUS6_PYTIN|nr:hypothetical protein P43SY_002554 [Pythium insidiosum]